ncbi:type II toxin-antitoxin system Phd/YefM family antitoxin [Pauljensenia hongkongensis]|uniref:Antitoxin PHD n=1 Tax=Pauljensenia hongkongensis TaxID=178339 RepID=A0A1D8B1H8_9ACTO|nr:antitoxin PHD [Pauljensenia hongkongensis]AOS46974.1 antitoxin PHD [Pauljensenia hongkongensis]EFW10367.1 prevent-host-death family antitoxin [Actinomyces sp. oral taxon 178 str. F0338]ERH33493.1 prevent-host-death family protein [Actinomyces sp. oral taxon 877 str. F0543]WLD79525.1 antitoxin PHD [Schaalia sp. HMT-877]
MRALDIGDFRENMGDVVARVSSGEVVTLMEGGVPVAELGPVRMSTLSQLRDLGLERPSIADVGGYRMPSKNLPDGRSVVEKSLGD